MAQVQLRATSILETSGPDDLAVGAWPDGFVLQRSGLTVIGVDRDGLDFTAYHSNVAAEIFGTTAAATASGADVLLIEQSPGWPKRSVPITGLRLDAAVNITSGVFADARIQESNVTQHQAALVITESQISDLDHTDPAAIHDNVAGEIAAVAAVGTLAAGDLFLLEDADDSNNKKRVTAQEVADLPQSIVMERWFAGTDYNAIIGDYRAENILTNGVKRFTFAVPADFGTLVSLDLIGIPSAGADGAGRDIDLSSDYALVGEASNTNSESDTTTTYDLTGTTGQITAVADLSVVFSSLAAGHVCGVAVTHNAIGGTIAYLGIRLRYTQT